MKIIITKDYQELSEKAAEIIIDLVKKNPSCTLGLATGSSPIGLYKNLIKAYEKGVISFKDVKSYNLDEYCELPKAHRESYYSFMHANLFDHIDIKEENTHLPSSEGSDLQANCKAYNKLLNSTVVDLQLLGIGANGHIGFNEPGTPFKNETSVIKLTDKTREDNKRFFDGDINQVPKYAITMGIKNILNAKSILLVANGKNKAEAIAKLVSGEVTEDLPASALNLHDNVTIIVDEDAASLIDK